MQLAPHPVTLRQLQYVVAVADRQSFLAPVLRERYPLPMMVIAEMLGIPVADREQLRRWSDVILDLSLDLAGGEEAARASSAYVATTAEMSVYLTALLAQRRATPRDVLLTRLVEAEVDGERLSDQEILGFFQLLLVAGTETTTNLINNAILCFIDHPDQLARLRGAPELLPAAIEEVLRYRSPVQAMFRTARHDIELRGQVIPAGKLVLPMIGSANRDPAHFRDPDRFDIARDPNPHLAFGHGIHFSRGAPLSRLEAHIALADLLQRAHDIELAGDQPWAPRTALHVPGPARLPIPSRPGPPPLRPDTVAAASRQATGSDQSIRCRRPSRSRRRSRLARRGSDRGSRRREAPGGSGLPRDPA
jgi:cytochrome P450